MGGFILRRLAISVPLIAIASFLIFCLVAASGDPLAELRENPSITERQIEIRRDALGLDKPFVERYVSWVGNAVTGDLGRSFEDNEEVTSKLWRAAGVTLRLLVVAVLLAVFVGILIGVVAALRQYTKFDYLATFFAFVFFSMPVFWLAAVLKDVGIRINDQVGYQFFETIGEQDPSLPNSAGFFTVWGDRLSHMILPVMTLVLIQVAAWSRYQRASMLDVLNADYVRTAKAKGLSARKVVVRHAMRNALIPIVTLVAIDFGLLMSGAVVTETVFQWNGMGQLLVTGLRERDANVVQGWLLVSATMVVVFNLVADVLYGYLDPRIRRA